MGSEWRTSKWGDLLSLEYGKSLRGYRDSQGKYRVFGSNGHIGWADTYIAEGPGVVLGRKGAYRGVEYCSEPFNVIDTAYYVKPKEILEFRWLYYAMKYYKVGEIDDGSPIPSTTRSAVYVSRLEVPSLPEQKAIAHILGTLDDKIELNRQTNQTLEAMAQALFKSWFVDFDHVIDNALAAGNEIPEPLKARAAARQALGGARKPLPEEIRLEFPDGFEFVDEMGWVPRGWDIVNIESIAEKIAMGPFGSNIKKVCSKFLLFYFRSASGQHKLLSNTSQVGVPSISRPSTHLKNIQMALPNLSLTKEFDRIVSGNYESIVARRGQSEILTNIRNTLLPKLLSGQLTIPDAEKLVADAL